MTNFEKVESIKEEIHDVFYEVDDYFALMGSKLTIKKHHYNDTSHINLEGMKKADPERFKLLGFQYFEIKSSSSLSVDDLEKFSNKKHSNIINDILECLKRLKNIDYHINIVEIKSNYYYIDDPQIKYAGNINREKLDIKIVVGKLL